MVMKQFNSVFAFLYNLMRKEQCIDDIMQLCVDVLIIELYAKGKRKQAQVIRCIALTVKCCMKLYTDRQEYK